ncbi:MAG: response regulator [Flavobacteriales bacterium]|nr:response regulator [Flavobacteriales bacterium]MCW8913524.1 response regulator [Flavobacteriales bacterium]MCW8938641.1 response regulator [Flavobacteriales bacterium]MCW8941451.1 response regulator [Flavobacteriales bacterium]MCW8968186.1 response regulator [Flavobacteriales bacterium]
MAEATKEQDNKAVILYLDDEQENLNSFKAAFRRDFKIYTAINAEEAEKILEKEAGTISIILSDQRMPKVTGIEFFEKIKEKYPEMIRILVTGYSDINVVIDAINKSQVYKYIQKPWDVDYMRKLIEQAFEVFTLRRENKKLTEDLLTVNAQLEFMFRQKLLSLSSEDDSKLDE